MCEVSAIGKISDCQQGSPSRAWSRVELCAIFFANRPRTGTLSLWSSLLTGGGGLKRTNTLREKRNKSRCNGKGQQINK